MQLHTRLLCFMRRGYNNPHSAYPECTEATMSHMDSEKVRIEAVASHIEDSVAHMTPEIAHTEAVRDHMAPVTAHIED